MKEVCLRWPNGKLKRKCFFKKGLRVGQDLMWNEEGQLVDEGNYKAGKPIGTHRRWDRKGNLIEEIVYLEEKKFNLRQWDEEGNLRVEAMWTGETYREKVWDRFQKIWIEKQGYWDGKKLVYS